MPSKELDTWLNTDESRSVGQKSGSSESVGHESGRTVVRLLHTKKADLGDEDVAHMRKVVGYVHRHLAQKPSSEALATSRWRYSLMNRGHDPLQD